MKQRLFALIATLGVASTAIAADEIVGGPVVVNVTPRTATILWLVNESGSTLTEAASNQKFSAQSVGVRKTVYTGLKAGTAYNYALPGGLTGRFKTAPAPTSTEPYTFIVYGDTRTRHDVHEKVMAEVVKTDADFILHTGDQVASGDDTSLWPVFFRIEKSVLAKTAFYPSLGNHERHASQYFQYFDQRTPYYSFNWGNAHIAVVDSDTTTAALGTEAQSRYWKDQVAWLEQDLERNKTATFKFVACHHPPFTAVSNRQGDNMHIMSLVPMLEKYGVTAMFNGHDHNYQHFEKNGIPYVTTGGGGAPLYDVDLPPAYITKKVEKTENFVRVRIEGNRATVEAIGTDGRVIDQFVMTGGAGSAAKKAAR